MKSFIGASGAQWQYDPGQELGKGGFGVVYAGEDANGDPIAVKKFDLGHPLAPSPDKVLREVQIGDRIAAESRTYLLPAIDHFMDGTTLLLVMERGERSLQDALDAGISEDEKLQAFRDVASGLMELHGIPVLHRDLKPQNVLRRDGVWKLADFGIARDLDESTATLTWKGAGTPYYMAPELFASPFTATVKSDLYALGCIGYQLFVGSVPFDAADAHELMRQHREEAVPTMPSSVNVTIRRVVMRLLEKDPNWRPQDARAVLDELKRVVLGPVSDAAKRLQGFAAEHVDEQAAASAKRSAEQAAAEARRQQVEQARADLAAIVDAGCDLVQEALPEVQYSSQGDHFTLTGEQATLDFIVWVDQAVRSVLGSPGFARRRRRRDDHILYGQVDGRNPRSWNDEAPLGNIVCEVRAGRMVWILYRYRGSGLAQFRLGPPDRQCGFPPQVFFGEHVYPYAFMEWTGMHVFQKDWKELTPEIVRDLYGSALALPKDA